MIQLHSLSTWGDKRSFIDFNPNWGFYSTEKMTPQLRLVNFNFRDYWGEVRKLDPMHFDEQFSEQVKSRISFGLMKKLRLGRGNTKKMFCEWRLQQILCFHSIVNVHLGGNRVFWSFWGVSPWNDSLKFSFEIENGFFSHCIQTSVSAGQSKENCPDPNKVFVFLKIIVDIFWRKDLRRRKCMRSSFRENRHF